MHFGSNELQEKGLLVGILNTFLTSRNTLSTNGSIKKFQCIIRFQIDGKVD